MLITNQQIIEDALLAFPKWNQIPVVQRCQLINHWAELLLTDPIFSEGSMKMVKHQSDQGLALLANTQVMPGPTGELNELMTSGRGIFVVHAEKEASIVAIVGLVASALVAGNYVVISLDESLRESAEQLQQTLITAGIFGSVLHSYSVQNFNGLIASKHIAGVAFVGGMEAAQAINLQLAERNGQIAQLIVETDHSLLTTLMDTHLLFRFITEKTRTINVTAVGGNAQLLALGSGD